MTRWHKPDCAAPDVVGDKVGAAPSCRACGSAPNLAEFIKYKADENSFPEPPPDKPHGIMNLWWPPSVPYRDIEGLPKDTNDLNDGANDPVSTPATGHGQAKEDQIQSYIYTRKLMPNEFRLACITASSDADFPIHLNLEIYSLDNCPDYETVSYCWAGEDGDSSRQLPIYVGPYWDVTLHTRNCWALLQFVRPCRGTRLVWVDALCINQACTEERAAQVAQMRRIYIQSTQVVAYLGPDVAHILPQGHYPRRHMLQEFESVSLSTSETVDCVETLLRRRYFSRLWVVQELILSPRVLIRVGDVDFWADGTATGSLWSSEDRDVAAHWVTHLAKGAPLELSLPKVMQLTHSTACADPRDRLFGVMGVVSDSYSPLEPDYSLSSQQVFIGLFAHLFITRGLQHLLAYGSGVARPPAVPSWVPDWTRWETWRPVFEPQGSQDLMEREVEFKLPINLAEKCTPHGTVLVPVVHPSGLHYPAPGHECQARAVDPKRGALLAQMVRFLVLSSAPKIIPESEGSDNSRMVFEAQWCYILREDAALGSRSFCLVASCDVVVFAFPYTVVCGDKPKNARTGITWPRLKRHPNDPSYDKLLEQWAFDRCVAEPYYREWTSPDWKHSFAGSLSVANMWLRANPVVGRLYWTLYEVIESIQGWLSTALEPQEQLFFLEKLNHQDVLPVYQAALDKGQWDLEEVRNAFEPTNRFIRVYKKHLRKNMERSFGDRYVTLTTQLAVVTALYQEHEFGDIWSEEDSSDWYPRMGTTETCRLVSVDNYREHRKHGYGLGQWGEHGEPAKFALQNRYTQDRPETKVQLAIPYTTIGYILLQSRGLRLVYMLGEAAKRIGEAKTQLMARIPTDADRLVRIPTGPYAEALINYCDCEGTSEEVIIF
ncbi:hypothetical protein DL767_000879 [Monosporascus sp. MG133]|nr:hypothetical protein DL767_000879 [Monosporascus sp. MG133]